MNKKLLSTIIMVVSILSTVYVFAEGIRFYEKRSTDQSKDRTMFPGSSGKDAARDYIARHRRMRLDIAYSSDWTKRNRNEGKLKEIKDIIVSSVKQSGIDLIEANDTSALLRVSFEENSMLTGNYQGPYGEMTWKLVFSLRDRDLGEIFSRSYEGTVPVGAFFIDGYFGISADATDRVDQAISKILAEKPPLTIGK